MTYFRQMRVEGDNMLQNLHVKNLALIDEVEVEFTNGLNILSGETGAGKSIIIGSINLALGEKISKEMIRDNDNSALVELIFLVKDKAQKAALKKLDIFPEDDLVIISRKIVNGRSVAKINAETVPISKIRDVAGILIDIHGQHEHQSLMHKKKHLEILDVYAKVSVLSVKEKLKHSYDIYRKLKEELNIADVDKAERERELSFLQYEVKEIEEAFLMIGEDETLEQEYKRLLNGRKIIEAVTLAYAQTGEGFECASEKTGHALKELSSVSSYDNKIASLESQMLEIDNLMNDFNRELAEYISDEQFEEEDFVRTERRLDEINHLKSKYGKSIDQILHSCRQKQERINKLEDYDGYLQELTTSLVKEEELLKSLSKELSGIRQKAAKQLSGEIQKALQDLNFLDVEFQMEFRQLADYAANGWDDAQFLISTNPGEPLKPLDKVASGGELSRIMLAIKTILADSDAIETLIFDEIDTGISGRTAQMVSEKMNVLGKNHQIICITHLPQIAAMADSHYLIAKSVLKQNTISTVRQLSETESVEELARMLGGVKITDTVLKSAKEMKVLAANAKKTMG